MMNMKAKVAAATEADKAKKLYKDLEATKKVVQTKLAKAEARLVELQAQPTARPDLSLFLTKALDSAKPDYTGLASLLIAARPAARLFVPGLRQRNQHIQFHN